MAWATVQWDWLDGWLLLHGVDVEQLPTNRVLNVLHAAMLEVSTYQVPVDKVLGLIDEKLSEELIVRRETWGLSPQAEERQRAMMDLAGGPAPMRDPT